MLRTIVNADPVNEFRALEDWFDRYFGAPTRPVPGPSTLPVDILEREGTLLVRAAVPGTDPNDLDVTVENNVLTIRGETKHDEKSESDKVYRREVSYGAFSRSIRLPKELDLKAIDAQFANGLVTVSIPKVPEAKPQALKVPIKTTGEQPAITQPAEPTTAKSN